MNLLEIIVMFKNADLEIFKKCFESWKNTGDYLTLVEGGTSDNDEVVNFIKSQKNKNIRYEKIEFTDFSTARNKCYDLSFNNCCFQMVLDDTYLIENSKALRNSLRKVVYEKKVNVIEVWINAVGVKYRSARIRRTTSGIKYVGKLHEVLNAQSNFVFDFPLIEDIQNEHNVNRTNDRLKYDLKFTKDYTNHRDCYYYCMSYYKLYNIQKVSLKECIDVFNTYIEKYKNVDAEQDFIALLFLGHLYYIDLNETDGIKSFISAACSYPTRSAEAYYTLYSYSQNNSYLQLAIHNYDKFNKNAVRLPSNSFVYDSIKNIIDTRD